MLSNFMDTSFRTERNNAFISSLGLKFVDEAWKYFVNHGQGRWINASSHMLEMFSDSNGDGICTTLNRGELKRLNCHQSTAYAVCRISKYLHLLRHRITNRSLFK